MNNTVYVQLVGGNKTKQQFSCRMRPYSPILTSSNYSLIVQSNTSVGEKTITHNNNATFTHGATIP